MADGPDRPPGQRSLFDMGVTRVEKRPPPEVDRAEVEREMEAKRQALAEAHAVVLAGEVVVAQQQVVVVDP
jgi:hypothetical protein